MDTWAHRTAVLCPVSLISTHGATALRTVHSVRSERYRRETWCHEPERSVRSTERELSDDTETYPARSCRFYDFAVSHRNVVDVLSNYRVDRLSRFSSGAHFAPALHY